MKLTTWLFGALHILLSSLWRATRLQEGERQLTGRTFRQLHQSNWRAEAGGIKPPFHTSVPKQPAYASGVIGATPSESRLPT